MGTAVRWIFFRERCDAAPFQFSYLRVLQPGGRTACLLQGSYPAILLKTEPYFVLIALHMKASSELFRSVERLMF